MHVEGLGLGVGYQGCQHAAVQVHCAQCTAVERVRGGKRERRSSASAQWGRMQACTFPEAGKQRIVNTPLIVPYH
jgi:hypothetical protein